MSLLKSMFACTLRSQLFKSTWNSVHALADAHSPVILLFAQYNLPFSVSSLKYQHNKYPTFKRLSVVQIVSNAT